MALTFELFLPGKKEPLGRFTSGSAQELIEVEWGAKYQFLTSESPNVWNVVFPRSLFDEKELELCLLTEDWNVISISWQKRWEPDGPVFTLKLAEESSVVA